MSKLFATEREKRESAQVIACARIMKFDPKGFSLAVSDGTDNNDGFSYSGLNSSGTYIKTQFRGPQTQKRLGKTGIKPKINLRNYSTVVCIPRCVL